MRRVVTGYGSVSALDELRRRKPPEKGFVRWCAILWKPGRIHKTKVRITYDDGTRKPRTRARGKRT